MFRDIHFCGEDMRANIEDSGIMHYDLIFDEYGIKIPEGRNQIRRRP